MRTLLFILFLGLFVTASNSVVAGQTAPSQTQLQQMADRFAPTPLRVDTSALSSGDRQALVKLIQASRLVNDIFMNQYWSGDLALYQRLQKDNTPLGRARFHYFWINKGPWSDIDEYKAFLPGVPPRKLPGANFYPENMTKEDFEQWLSALTPEEQEQAKGFFTVIRRKPPLQNPKDFSVRRRSCMTSSSLCRTARSTERT